MLIEGIKFQVDFVSLDVLDFDVILGIDWQSQHYAIVDCRRKEVIFRTLNFEGFKFVGDKSFSPQNFISAITARRDARIRVLEILDISQGYHI